ncbi:MAG: hypothetical protein V8Q43_04430 [Christensenellaceae bacterium]
MGDACAAVVLRGISSSAASAGRSPVLWASVATALVFVTLLVRVYGSSIREITRLNRETDAQGSVGSIETGKGKYTYQVRASTPFGRVNCRTRRRWRRWKACPAWRGCKKNTAGRLPADLPRGV